MKSKLKIIIPIAIAITAIILAFIFIQFKPKDVQVEANSLDIAQSYLVEQSYEQAIAEFKKIIEIDPMNVDAYIGIAEAYEAMGDVDSAVEWLEKGYEFTGDGRILDYLNRLKAIVEDVDVTEENTSAVENSDVEVTTIGTVIKSEVEERAEVIKQRAYDEVINKFIGYNYGESGTTEYYYFKIYQFTEQYVLIKMEYGTDEFLEGKDVRSGNWLKETNITNGNILAINTRQFAGNTYMNSVLYDMDDKEKYKSKWWNPATEFTFPIYRCSDFIFEKNENGTYVYKHWLYDEYFDAGYGYKLYVQMSDENIETIKLEQETQWNYVTKIMFTFDDKENTWIAESNSSGISERIYPYNTGLPYEYDEDVFNVVDSEFTEVYSHEDFYDYNY